MMMSRTTVSRRRPTNNRMQRAPDTENNQRRKHRPDYLIIVLASILTVVGAVTVYAISPGLTQAQGLPSSFYSEKQLVAIALGLVVFAIASRIPIEFWKRSELLIVGAAAIMSVAVRVIGEPINGAYRWLDIAGFSFQAAEFIKFALVIWLASFFVRARRSGTMTSPATLKQLGIAVVSVALIVAGLQSDLGSAAVMMAIIGIVAFVAGLPMKRLGIVVIAVIVLSVAAVMISPYRRDRVSTFLNPTADCQNEGFQACQALITVGSGGVVGKGLGRSVQAYGYLPEAANDSIFAIIAEKYGFLGTGFIIVVFSALLMRLKTIAAQAATDYERFVVTGLLAWLSIQMMINVGAMLGLLPLKGITLPLISYGGTSIIFVMAALGVAFQVSRYTSLQTTTEQAKAVANRRQAAHTNISRWRDA